MSHELSLTSISEDGGSKEESSCVELWAFALIFELGHFVKQKNCMLPHKVVRLS